MKQGNILPHFHSTNKLPLNLYHPALQTNVAAERGKLFSLEMSMSASEHKCVYPSSMNSNT